MLRRTAWMKWLPPMAEQIAVAAEDRDLEVGTGHLEAGGEGNGPAMGGVEGVEFHIAGDAARAADA